MREKKVNISAIVIMIFVIIIVGVVYGNSSFQWLKKITGYASTTQNVGLNITVGVPQIVRVYNETVVNLINGPNEGNSDTNITVNFTVYNSIGTSSINHTSSKVNVTKAGEAVRQNVSCQRLETATNYVNYTCKIQIFWFDGAGNYSINAFILDNSSNSAQNGTTSFNIGTTTGFVIGPTNLTWGGIGAGAINQTSSNDPIIMNNTGNVNITAGNIQINATNLRGETTNTLALWAENFSVGFISNSTLAECGRTTSTIMNRTAWGPVDIANLTAGNFTINNNVTGQEELFFCLRLAGSELTSQSYSTMNESTWTIKIA